MKDNAFYQNTLRLKTKDEVFNYLISSLKPSNTLWSYFVNWEKVFRNVGKIEVSLHILNYLIGKKDFDDAFRFLLSEHPEVLRVIPLLAVRDGKNTSKFEILVDYSKKRLVYKEFDFTKNSISNKDIEQYLEFVQKTGIKNLLTNGSISNLQDYLIGVEAGLDSNGRKNRGGHAMESIVEAFIKDICDRNHYRYLKEANAKSIHEHYGYVVPVDKSSRRYDFVIDNGHELFIIETNFYGGGGSKLKSTAGEYRNLYDTLNGQFPFVWITDGLGWKSTHRPLRETFDHNDYLFNLAMLENGALEFILRHSSSI